jgi:hypothetical protein
VYEARKGALRLIPTGETKTATLKALSRAFKGINRETLKMMQQSAGNSTDDEDEEEDEEEDDEDTTEQNGHKAQKFGSSYQVSNRTMNVLTLDAPDEDGLIEMGTASIDRSTPQRSGNISSKLFATGLPQEIAEEPEAGPRRAEEAAVVGRLFLSFLISGVKPPENASQGLGRTNILKEQYEAIKGLRRASTWADSVVVNLLFNLRAPRGGRWRHQRKIALLGGRSFKE